MLLAALVAAVVVPVGFALSLESISAPQPVAPTAGADNEIVAMTTTAAPLWFSADDTSWSTQLVDGPGLFLAGGILFGLATVLKRAV